MIRRFAYKRLLLILVACFCMHSVVWAQCSETAKKHKNQGIALYKNGQYKDAKKWFNVAIDCPELTNKEKDELNGWIERCNTASKKKAQEAANTPSGPVKPSKGEVEYTHVSCSTVCNDNQGGLSFKVCFQVKGLKGKQIGVRCLLFPERGIPVPRKEFNPNGEYSVYGGKLGLEKTFSISSDEEYFSEIFYVPFNVIDFGGDYVTQAMGVTFHVFEPGGNASSENMRPIQGGTYRDRWSVTPVAITINGSAKDVNIPVGYDGGVYSPRIATCGGDFQWGGDIPYWITIDDNGIDVHVSENKSNQQREATIKLMSNAGWGNVITIRVRQKGR